MGKHKVKMDDYEENEGSGYSGEEPKRGVYDGILVSVKDHTSGNGNEGLEWIFEITEEPYAGWRGWVYSNLDSTKWKTQQIVKAITGSEDDYVIVTDDEDGKKSKPVKDANPVRLQIKQEEYEGEKRGRIRTILVNENAPAKKKGGKKKKKGDDPF